MQLYIIRHAQSTNNALTNREDRGCDPPLTDLGRQQAELLAQHLATGTQREPAATAGRVQGYGLTHLYCSPMWRALLTAQPVGQALGLAPEVWIEIHEQGGIYLDEGDQRAPIGRPGKTRAEILADFPNYILPDGITKEGWWKGARDDRASCIARAVRVTQRLRERCENEERVALVSHAGFTDALLKALLNQLPGHDLRYHQYNAAISRIDIEAADRVHVRYLNRLDHLPPRLIT